MKYNTLRATHTETLRQHVEQGGNATSYAKANNLNERTVRRWLSDLKATGYDPENGRCHRNGYDQSVSGYSTLTRFPENDPYGRVLEWVKTSRTEEQNRQDFEAFAADFLKDYKAVTAINAPKNNDDDLIPWFNIGDAHLGMLAYHDEVGHSFDMEIAERELKKAIDLMIRRTPKTKRCVLQDMGDFTHYENEAGLTEASGHQLDCDTRYHKMIRVYARIMRYMIDRLLEAFGNVDVIINQGNHSRKNDHWMAVTLPMIYENNKRLMVLNNGSVFIPYRMGNTFVMCHHSDKCKPAALASVMAIDFAHDWGETYYHYIDVGHVHHKSVTKETNGAIIESFNQLAPSDKYSHDGGWRSRAFLTVVLRSKTYGEKGRIVVTAEEVKDLLSKVPAGTEANRRRKVYTV